MNQQKHIFKSILNNLIVIFFPLTLIVLMYFASGFISAMRKLVYLNSFFFVYAMFCTCFFVFLYLFLHKTIKFSWLSLIVGISELIFFHFSSFFQFISFDLFSKIWRIYPYNFFLLDIMLIVYCLMAFIKIRKIRTS